MKKKPIVLIGRADCWKEDLKQMKSLVTDFDVMAVGMDCLYGGEIQYFVTYHPRDISEYISRRRFADVNTDFQTICHVAAPGVDIIEQHIKPSGSSALLGVSAAIRMGYQKIILCGCPMAGKNKNQGGSYDQFQKGWIARRKELEGIVKSMSGWTKNFFGEPTKEWLMDREDEMKTIIALFENKAGIEVGGPSRIFSKEGRLPLYSVVKSLDGCNFSSETLWEKGLVEGNTYNFYADKVGMQYICEATELANRIGENKYDFLISSNCLEHIANALKAVENFVEVVRPGGIILLVLPRKEATFDHKRSVTSFKHLYEDYLCDIGKDDLTHLDEILSLHDLSLDPPAGNLENFKKRSLDNYRNRGLHHHVFDEKLIQDVFLFNKLELSYFEDTGAEYIAIGMKKF